MIALHRRVPAELPPGACRLVLQIHDELIFEVAEACLPAAAALVRDCMEGAVQLSVRLPVTLRAGPSWGELRELQG